MYGFLGFALLPSGFGSVATVVRAGGSAVSMPDIVPALSESARPPSSESADSGAEGFIAASYSGWAKREGFLPDSICSRASSSMSAKMSEAMLKVELVRPKSSSSESLNSDSSEAASVSSEVSESSSALSDSAKCPSKSSSSS